MDLLPIPVPPQLEAAVGYPGEARWVALCWTSLGDTCVYDDGRLSGTGHGWAYLGFVRHAAVAPHLAHADLGSSEDEGRERLLIDRTERRAYLCGSAEARSLVCRQWPDEPAVELTREEWSAVVEDVRQRMLSRPLPGMDQLMRQMREHSSLVADMIRFLDVWQADQAR